MSIQVPTFAKNLAAGVEKWGLAHISYVATAAGFLALGLFLGSKL